MSTEIMLDIETFGNKMNSPVLSIGAVYRHGDGHLRKFSVNLNLDAQFKMGLKPNQDTIQWWMQQSEDARKVFKALPKGDYNLVDLKRFCEFIEHAGPAARVWGYGANFDQPMLECLLSAYGLENPWGYNKAMCFRTLVKMEPLVDWERFGTYHNGLDDAITQLFHLEKIFLAKQRRDNRFAQLEEQECERNKDLKNLESSCLDI